MNSDKPKTKYNKLFLVFGLAGFFCSFLIDSRLAAAFSATSSLFLIITTTVFLFANKGLLGVRWEDLRQLEEEKNKASKT